MKTEHFNASTWAFADLVTITLGHNLKWDHFGMLENEKLIQVVCAYIIASRLVEERCLNDCDISENTTIVGSEQVKNNNENIILKHKFVVL